MSLITSTKKAGAGTSPSIDTTGASFITAVISGGGTISLSDNKGNTYTQRTVRTGGFGSNTAIFDCSGPAVGTGHTFTIGGTNPGTVIGAFVGPTAVTAAFDVESGAGEGASPVSPGSITPNHSDELVVLGVGGQASSFTPGTGYTLVDFLAIVGGVNFAAGLAYQQQTTATATNPSSTTTTVASCVLAAYRVNNTPGGPLTAGVLSKDLQEPYRLGVSWTHSTGGTTPIVEQLQRSVAGAGVWLDVFGMTYSPALDETPVPGVGYDFKVAYTDATATTVYSNTVTFGATRTLVEYLPTTQIGTAGSFGGNPATTKDKVFDGDWYTGFESPNPTGDWVGIDLGTGHSGAVGEIWYAAWTPPADGTALGGENYVVGMKFQMSDDPTFATGVTDLYTIPAEPAPVGRQWTKVGVNLAGTAKRCFRALSAPSSYTRVAGLRFFGAPATGVDQAPAPPMLSPFGGGYSAGSRVETITSPTDTAAVYYTTDGTTPDNTKTRYAGPFTLTIGGSGTTLKAVAYSAGLSTPYSEVVSADFYPYDFAPDQVWYDNNGNRVQAQGGHQVYSEERWFWFGMGSNRFTGNIDALDHYATNQYSSSDQRNWRFDKVALGTPYAGAAIYRVHVVESTADSRWVIWVNNFVSGEQYRMLGATTGPSIRDPWQWLGTPAAPGDWPVSGRKFWDANVAVHDDGTHYFYINDGGIGIDVTAIDAARTSPTGTNNGHIVDGEAPTPFIRGSVDFVIRSAGNYYEDNTTYHPQFAYSTSGPLGTWSAQFDLFTSDPLGTAYNAQPNQVIRIPGKTDAYMYASDKWKLKPQSPLGQGLWESTQVCLPLTFPTSTSVQAQRPASWSIQTQWPDVYTKPVLTLTSVGATSATLSWTAASGGTSPYTYKLQRAANVYADWEDVSGGTTSPVNNTGLTAGRAYEFRVRCVDNAGVVVFSNPVTVVTQAAGGVFPFHLDNELSGATYALGM